MERLAEVSARYVWKLTSSPYPTCLQVLPALWFLKFLVLHPQVFVRCLLCSRHCARGGHLTCPPGVLLRRYPDRQMNGTDRLDRNHEDDWVMCGTESGLRRHPRDGESDADSQVEGSERVPRNCGPRGAGVELIQAKWGAAGVSAGERGHQGGWEQTTDLGCSGGGRGVIFWWGIQETQLSQYSILITYMKSYYCVGYFRLKNT